MAAEPEGITSGNLVANQALYTILIILVAIAWYNVLELIFLIFVTFKRYNGLYFWALMIASWGTALQSLGFLLKFFPTGTNIYLCVTIITIGWWSMVTGQSVVLYSRMSLVVQNPKILRRVLTMIIVDAIIFHIPTTVLTFGANSNKAQLFAGPYSIMEKIQMTGFTLQEIIISVIYVRATFKLFGPRSPGSVPKEVIELLLVNCFIIVMDLALLGVEYASLYDIEVMLKSLIYSIKLKLEFAVLSDLKNYKDPALRKASAAPTSTWDSRRKSSAPAPWRGDQSSIVSPISAGGHIAFDNMPDVKAGGKEMTHTEDVTLFNDWNFDGHASGGPKPPMRTRTRQDSIHPAASFISQSDSEAEFGAYEEHERDDDF